jgi:hypothetical protein
VAKVYRWCGLVFACIALGGLIFSIVAGSRVAPSLSDVGAWSSLGASLCGAIAILFVFFWWAFKKGWEFEGFPFH